jgi:hypothetical protein
MTLGVEKNSRDEMIKVPDHSLFQLLQRRRTECSVDHASQIAVACFVSTLRI